MRPLAITSLILVATGAIIARPINLDPPSGTLGSSDAMGFVEMWKEVQDIDFGDGLTLPFRFGFTSRPDRDSSLFGRGWIVPIVDSHAAAINETTYRAELICGKVLYLHHNAADVPTRYQTQNGDWIGTVDGENFTVSRDDGWSLRYHKGQLAELKTDKGRDIVWNYGTDGTFTSIEEVRGQTGLSVARDVDGTPLGFSVGNQKYAFTLGKRPMPEQAATGRFIGDLVPTLASFQWPLGNTEKFTFGVTSSMDASLEIDGADGQKVDYTWDPVGHILSDRGWTYQVGPLGKNSNLPSLTRTNAKGKSESIAIATAAGIVVQTGLDGVTTTTHLFRTPGPNFNKVHEITQTVNGVTRLLQQRNYDDAGRLIRSLDPNGAITSYTYDETGKLLNTAVRMDPDILAQLRSEAEAKFKAIATAPDKTTRDALLDSLGHLYANDMADTAKALAVAPLMSDHGLAYRLSIGAIFYDRSMTSAQKIAAYQKLLPLYPECAGGLRFLMAELQPPTTTPSQP